jgi:hypothetical protein
VSAARDDGGPAFGVADVRDADGVGIAQGHPGMSLRDYFAAKAMAAILSTPEDAPWVKADGAQCKTLREIQARISEVAYGYADAMIAERKK